MPTHSSRYIRPEHPPPALLTVRDRAILTSVYEHRYLSAEHIHRLVFSEVGVRRAQERLRRLWSHRFLDRHFIPFLLDGEHPPPATAGRPFYILAARGAAIIAAEHGLNPVDIPRTRKGNASGYATLEHNLVVTDLMVALIVACRGRRDIAVASIERETQLRQKVAARPLPQRTAELPIVPDGAFTLSYPLAGTRSTFYIEVVRAGVKGGNETLARRFGRYAEAHHRGLFRRLYGHETIRAVLILTPTAARVGHYTALAAQLSHGSRLFWFTAYATRDERGRETTTLTKETVLAPRWQTGVGEFLSFLPVAAPPRPIAESVSNPQSNVCPPHTTSPETVAPDA